MNKLKITLKNKEVHEIPAKVVADHVVKDAVDSGDFTKGSQQAKSMHNAYMASESKLAGWAKNAMNWDELFPNSKQNDHRQDPNYNYDLDLVNYATIKLEVIKPKRGRKAKTKANA